MSFISVIDEDYDTSLSISWDEIEERINRQCSIALKASPENRTKITIPMNISIQVCYERSDHSFPGV